MTFEEYQNFAKQNHKPGCDETVFALGLGGETGEVLEIIKKAKRDLKPVDVSHLKEELGDVVWYVANLCTAYGLALEEVLDFNVAKLCERYAEPLNYIAYASENVAYRKNGPHIEKVDATTGKHIKFCAAREVPAYALDRLRREEEERKAAAAQKKIIIVSGADDDCPFD